MAADSTDGAAPPAGASAAMSLPPDVPKGWARTG